MTDDTAELAVEISAAIAILFGETGAEWLVATLAHAEHSYMSAGTYLELGIVLESRYGPAGTGTVDRFVLDSELDIVEMTPVVAVRALEGWRRYG